MPLLGARAHDYHLSTPDDVFSAIKNDGFSVIQLATKKSFGMPYPLTDEQIALLQGALSRSGIQIAVLGCYINPALPDKQARIQEVDTFISALPACKALGAGCVGTETTRFTGTEAQRAVAFEWLLEGVQRMAEAAEKHGVTVGIEPVAEHVLNTPELAAELLRRVGSSRVKIIFDAVNLITAPYRFTQAAFFRRCLNAFEQHIIAMHVKDTLFTADGEKVSAPLFDGQLDWPILLNWAKDKPNLPLLREEAMPERSVREIQKMRHYLEE